MKDIITSRARSLRQNQTPAEKLFWQRVRKRQFHGLKFLRQHPIILHINNRTRYFIIDFYCHEHRLAVEIDGDAHDNDDQKEYDERRTFVLEDTGIRVVRFLNREVFGNMEWVLERLWSFCESGRCGGVPAANNPSLRLRLRATPDKPNPLPLKRGRGRFFYQTKQ